MTTVDCEYELNFLRDILKKCHVRSVLLSLHDNADTLLDPQIGSIVGDLQADMTVQRVMGRRIESNTKYKFRNEIGLQYIFLRLPVAAERNLLFIGPYLSAPLTQKELFESGERLGLAPNMQNVLREYYASLPVLSDGDSIFTVIDAFCEHIWQTPSFSIVDINGTDTLHILPTDPSTHGESLDTTLANMKMIEMRYAFENELIQAVTLGQQHKEQMFSAAFNDQMFEHRLQDSVRNAKNYCIIMNTLLRKAAETGGVHPIYIDRVSSDFAAKIERAAVVKEIYELMREMFSSYCRLVHKHSTQKYSAVVKSAVLMIDSDISAEISLRTLAEKLGITSGYLATVFKRETGKTVSEYIRDRRISHAVHLLRTTSLQIQTVAMHCGIMDVQYFSKLFKKQIGKTPKEYRDTIRR